MLWPWLIVAAEVVIKVAGNTALLHLKVDSSDMADK